MSLLERIYYFHSRITADKFPNAQDIVEEFEVSSATAHRDISYLRDRLLAPLAFSQKRNGYFYQQTDFHLPFEKSDKIVLFLGLLTTIAVETGLGQLPELLQLRKKLTSLAVPGKKDIEQYLHCEWVETEAVDNDIFTTIINGLLAQKKLSISYPGTKGNTRKRPVEPLKLLHYQGRWYLYAWCGLRLARRLFHVARIRSAVTVDEAIQHVMNQEDNTLTGVFGIFKGETKYSVTIHFKGHAARTVKHQHWHPAQIIEETGSGILFTLPVADDREIMMKILQFGAQAEIIAPQHLREKLAAELRNMSNLYNE